MFALSFGCVSIEQPCYCHVMSYGEMMYTLFMSFMARDNILIDIH